MASKCNVFNINESHDLDIFQLHINELFLSNKASGLKPEFDQTTGSVIKEV